MPTPPSMLFPVGEGQVGGEQSRLTWVSQLLPRQAHRLRLQGSEGDPGLQAPRDLGQGHPAARYETNISQAAHYTDTCVLTGNCCRQLWRRPRQVRPPSPH